METNTVDSINTVYAWLTLFAIFSGPVIAVLLTRWIDARSEDRGRKMLVFRNLMQTRGIRLDPAHVAALNIVEVEFYKSSNISDAFRAYIKHLMSAMPPVADQKAFFAEQNDLLIDLIFKIGKELKLDFDKRDLEKFSYVPQGWEDDQTLQRKNANLLSQILSGQRPIAVSNHFSGTSPFPDPPQRE